MRHFQLSQVFLADEEPLIFDLHGKGPASAAHAEEELSGNPLDGFFRIKVVGFPQHIAEDGSFVGNMIVALVAAFHTDAKLEVGGFIFGSRR